MPEVSLPLSGSRYRRLDDGNSGAIGVHSSARLHQEQVRIEQILVELFGSIECAISAMEQWPVVIAATYEDRHLFRLTMEKMCPRHGRYCNLTAIVSRDDLEYAKATLDTNTCLSCLLGVDKISYSNGGR